MTHLGDVLLEFLEPIVTKLKEIYGSEDIGQIIK